MQGNLKTSKAVMFILLFLLLSSFPQATATEHTLSAILTAERTNESIVLDGWDDEGSWENTPELIVPVK